MHMQHSRPDSCCSQSARRSCIYILPCPSYICVRYSLEGKWRGFIEPGGLFWDLRFLDYLELRWHPLLKWFKVLRCCADGIFEVNPVRPRSFLPFIACRKRLRVFICLGKFSWNWFQHLPDLIKPREGRLWLALANRSVWGFLVGKVKRLFKNHAKVMLQILHGSLRSNRSFWWATWRSQALMAMRQFQSHVALGRRYTWITLNSWHVSFRESNWFVRWKR